MTTSTHILIITLICLVIASFAILCAMGKLDGWYCWSLSDDDKPTEQRMRRWRIVFTAEILIFLAMIILLNATDIYDKYSAWVYLVIAIGGSLAEKLWVRKS